jgi:hypothetical protein
LRDGRKCEVRRPRLDENHVDSQDARSIGATCEEIRMMAGICLNRTAATYF